MSMVMLGYAGIITMLALAVLGMPMAFNLILSIFSSLSY